jgi:hypothetical protein
LVLQSGRQMRNGIGDEVRHRTGGGIRKRPEGRYGRKLGTRKRTGIRGIVRDEIREIGMISGRRRELVRDRDGHAVARDGLALAIDRWLRWRCWIMRRQFFRLAEIEGQSGETVARPPAGLLIGSSRGCETGRIIVGRLLKPHLCYGRELG